MITPTEKDFRDLFKVLDADRLQSNKIVMSQDDFDMLLGPIVKAVRLLLDTISKRKAEKRCKEELKRYNKTVVESLLAHSHNYMANNVTQFIDTKIREASFLDKMFPVPGIIKAARKLLNRLHLDIDKKGGPFMLDDVTLDCEAEIKEVLMKISEHPDVELSEQQATLLCQRFVKELDDTKPDIVNAAYITLSHFLPMASKETRDAIIPAMVVHDL